MRERTENTGERKRELKIQVREREGTENTGERKRELKIQVRERGD